MSTPEETRPAPRRGRQVTLSVQRTEHLTPHMVRVILGGPEIADFEVNGSTDMYVKLYFPPAGSPLVPPYDLPALRAELPGDELPVMRTYTVRSHDAEAGTLAIDFVVHGDEGIAGPWANTAQPGDTLTLAGPGGAYAPKTDAPWHLLVGDESALPAIAAALEALPADATGVALIEVAGPDEEQDLVHPAGVELRWLGRGGSPAGTSTVLAEAVEALEWRDGTPHAFVHGEREGVKRLRDHLFGVRGLTRSDISISGYWAYGRTEDRFQAEKREAIGAV